VASSAVAAPPPERPQAMLPTSTTATASVDQNNSDLSFDDMGERLQGHLMAMRQWAIEALNFIAHCLNASLPQCPIEGHAIII
jgi:hypothetical protein